MSNDDNRKQVSFRLDDEVRKELRIYVLKNNTSIQELLENFVLKLLEAEKNKSNDKH